MLDISDEMYLIRYDNGIKLFKSRELKRLISSEITYSSIANILELPFAVYLEDTQHITKKCNEIMAEECGFSSMNDCIDRPWFDPFKSETIEQSLANDRSVVRNNKTGIFYEEALRKDGNSIDTLSVRMPWFNHENKIIGLFGCSIIMGKCPLAESLTYISNLGLLAPNQIKYADHLTGTKINSVYLTKRELECLRLTIRGKTAQNIANKLGLSKWTVEEYLANIKHKMNVSSKAELIDKTIDYFISNMVHNELDEKIKKNENQIL